uniref:Secreted protein n=1 Tax=Periophthalmus magnuspinnatus TaxID=409849 RepID=A0A3B3ZMA5_9GOBI
MHTGVNNKFILGCLHLTLVFLWSNLRGSHPTPHPHSSQSPQEAARKRATLQSVAQSRGIPTQRNTIRVLYSNCGGNFHYLAKVKESFAEASCVWAE